MTHAKYIAAPAASNPPPMGGAGRASFPHCQQTSADTATPAPHACQMQRRASLLQLQLEKTRLLRKLDGLRMHPNSRAYSICEADIRRVTNDILREGPGE